MQIGVDEIAAHQAAAVRSAVRQEREARRGAQRDSLLEDHEQADLHPGVGDDALHRIAVLSVDELLDRLPLTKGFNQHSLLREEGAWKLHVHLRLCREVLAELPEVARLDPQIPVANAGHAAAGAWRQRGGGAAGAYI